MDKTTFNSLKEMLLDERKLITYVSLSKEMCIHVNDSKSFLKQIVDYLKTNEPDIQLNINYVVSGLLDNNKAHTAVCNEADLEDLKAKLKTIFYQHLYSVSVGPAVVDNVSYMSLNKFSDFPLCTGYIKGPSCIKRTTDEIRGLKTTSQENVTIEQKPSISAVKIAQDEKKITKNNTFEVKQVAKIQETKSEPIIKNEITSPKKESVSSKNSTKTQKGIAGFFSKSNSVPANKAVNGNRDIEQSKKFEQEKPQVVDVPKVKAEKMDVDEEKSEKPTKELKKNEKVKETKDKSKSLNTIKKNAMVEKKRKRVLHVSDSESEDEKNDPFVNEPLPDPDLESEDEIPPTPLVNTVKITSGIMNPKKKRKIVDKTYTDEDGYILTKKEEVYESCSENEEEVSVKENVSQVNKVIKTEVSPPAKKNGTKNGKKKIASPQKGKQATLMSFFKKVPQK